MVNSERAPFGAASELVRADIPITLAVVRRSLLTPLLRSP